MKRLAALLLLLGLPARAGSFHCVWNFEDFTGGSMAVRQVTLQPVAAYGVNTNTPAIIPGDLRSYRTTSATSLTVSNLINGRAYRVSFYGPLTPWGTNLVTVFTNNFDATVSGLVNAADYLAAPLQVDNNVVAYSQAGADARFHNVSGDSSTNPVFYGTIQFPATNVNGYVWTATNDTGAGFWSESLGGGSGKFPAAGNNVTAVTNGNTVTISADVSAASVAAKANTNAPTLFGRNILLARSASPGVEIPYATLALAMADAAAGDTILIRGSNYVAAPVVLKDGVTLSGHGNNSLLNGDSGSFLLIWTNSNVTVKDLKLRSTSTAIGWLTTDRYVITNCTFRGLDIYATTNGVYLTGPAPTNRVEALFKDCVINTHTNNAFGYGAAFGLATNSAVVLQNCNVYGGIDGAIGQGHRGGNLFILGGIYTSDLDGITSAGGDVLAIGARSRGNISGGGGSNGDLFQDDGTLTALWCDYETVDDGVIGLHRIPGSLEVVGAVTANSFAGSGGSLTVDASGFNGNLATGDNTLQEVAQKLDDLVVTGGGIGVTNGSGTNVTLYTPDNDPNATVPALTLMPLEKRTTPGGAALLVEAHPPYTNDLFKGVYRKVSYVSTNTYGDLRPDVIFSHGYNIAGNASGVSSFGATDTNEPSWLEQRESRWQNLGSQSQLEWWNGFNTPFTPWGTNFGMRFLAFDLVWDTTNRTYVSSDGNVMAGSFSFFNPLNSGVAGMLWQPASPSQSGSLLTLRGSLTTETNDSGSSGINILGGSFKIAAPASVGGAFNVFLRQDWNNSFGQKPHFFIYPQGSALRQLFFGNPNSASENWTNVAASTNFEVYGHSKVRGTASFGASSTMGFVRLWDARDTGLWAAILMRDDSDTTSMVFSNSAGDFHFVGGGSVNAAGGFVGPGSGLTGDDEAYDATGWNGDTSFPTKNAVRDKIESLGGGSVSDAAYSSSWNGDTTTAPSKNAVFDELDDRPRVLHRASAAIGFTNSSDENTIMSFTLPANTLGTNRSVQINLGGGVYNQQAGGATGNWRLRVYLGDTKIYDDLSASVSSQPNFRPIYLDFSIAAQGSAAQTMIGQMMFVDKVTSATTGYGDISSAANIQGLASVGGLSTVDLSTNVTISITAQMSVATNAMWVNAAYSKAVLY
jgi:hypothetical protein